MSPANSSSPSVLLSVSGLVPSDFNTRDPLPFRDNLFSFKLMAGPIYVKLAPLTNMILDGAFIEIASGLLNDILPSIRKVPPFKTMSPSSQPSIQNTPPAFMLTPPGNLN